MLCRYTRALRLLQDESVDDGLPQLLSNVEAARIAGGRTEGALQILNLHKHCKGLAAML